jgi:hypothetical protein
MTEYDISRTSGQCSVTGRPFDEEEDFYTAVLETPDGLQRCDVSIEAWKGPPEGTLCHFKTRMPQKDAPRKTFVDDNVLIDVFRNLSDAQEANKVRFRFVLSLILLRKRLLKYEKTTRRDDGEYWEMRLTRDKSLHRIFNPSLTEAEIQSLSNELSAVLNEHLAGDLEAADQSGQAEPQTDSDAQAALPEAEGTPS